MNTGLEQMSEAIRAWRGTMFVSSTMGASAPPRAPAGRATVAMRVCRDGVFREHLEHGVRVGPGSWCRRLLLAVGRLSATSAPRAPPRRSLWPDRRHDRPDPGRRASGSASAASSSATAVPRPNSSHGSQQVVWRASRPDIDPEQQRSRAGQPECQPATTRIARPTRELPEGRQHRGSREQRGGPQRG